MEQRLDRQARNEALIREVNERIDAIAEEEPVWDEGGLFDFICECGRQGGCHAVVQLTLTEYEEVRAQDDRFLVAPGHETDGLENITKRTDRYLIVDKLPGAEPFVEDDPRGAPSH
jgi:hypothetical protein